MEEYILSSLLGIIGAFVMLILAFILEEGKPSALISLTPAMIVIGGTMCAVIIGFPMSTLKKMGKAIKVAFGGKKADLPKLIFYFKDVSTKTRRNGLLSLESEISGSENVDPFIKKGLQMVVDGLEPQSVKATLELQLEMMAERHHACIGVLEAAGGFSPTLGVLGTVMGLVQVLSNLSDPAALGGKIATAFIATLYGVGFANLIYLPLATKLKNLNNEDILEKMLIIEAVTLIQEGVNPNVISEKLKSFLDAKGLAAYDSLDKAVEA
jgi:chemotaxis protein MotA